MTDSFYVPLGDGRWRATRHTVGPWDERTQHGGPASALLGREIQRCAPREDLMVSRFTCEILRAIPAGELSVRARVARPGRSVELLEAVADAAGREVLRASAWRVLRTHGGPVPAKAPQPPKLPAQQAPRPHGAWVDGYLSAMEWRAARDGLSEPGPATVWGRMRYPLVPDEEPSALERVLAIADSGNGVSWELDLGSWLFINPELTVHLHREAAGEWICLDAQTTITTGGTGLATSVLSDLSGPVGVGAQSLLIAPRPGGAGNGGTQGGAPRAGGPGDVPVGGP
jgi:acyl-Coa thioesterase superfamily protein/acyl-CoA thioesterase superfamily protein